MRGPVATLTMLTSRKHVAVLHGRLLVCRWLAVNMRQGDARRATEGQTLCARRSVSATLRQPEIMALTCSISKMNSSQNKFRRRCTILSSSFHWALSRSVEQKIEYHECLCGGVVEPRNSTYEGQSGMPEMPRHTSSVSCRSRSKGLPGTHTLCELRRQ